MFICLFIYLFLKCIHFERETVRQRERAGEGQRERERERERERIPSRLHALGAEPDAGLDPRNREIMT